MVEYLRLEQIPDLNRPALVLAFEGWNDAAESASGSLEFLGRTVGARRFAAFDSEEFYSFTETRPMVKLNEDVREIQWPDSHFSYAHREGDGRDLILLRGVEPQLRWRTFSQLVSGVARSAGVDLVVCLGALLAEVPHTQPVRITGTSTDPELTSIVGLEPSRYEGPTGILGVLHQHFKTEGIPCVSIWANVPHYIPAFPNPRATVALLGRVNSLLNLELDLSEFDSRTAEFDEQIRQGLSQNPEVAEYVSELESRVGEEDEPHVVTEDLPSGESLVADLEKFLRSQREDEGKE
ncbi:MAG: PAC2 family protein [Dehalococcoidia bacterium]|nr:PAC2 family protein [Dehalococcoidia bacterium]